MSPCGSISLISQMHSRRYHRGSQRPMWMVVVSGICPNIIRMRLYVWSSEDGRRKGGINFWGWQWIYCCSVHFRSLFTPQSNSVFTHYTFLPQLQIQRTLWYSLLSFFFFSLCSLSVLVKMTGESQSDEGVLGVVFVTRAEVLISKRLSALEVRLPKSLLHEPPLYSRG